MNGLGAAKHKASSIVPLPGRGAHVHKMIAQTAEEMAQEVYEEWASRDNEFYKKYSDREDYVRRCWPLYIEAARATLAQMLASTIDEALKIQIHEALIRDATLRRGREGVLQMKKGKGV